MANEEALGPRKTMLVLVIVVGCFAVLWPRLLSPLLLGRDHLKPNQFDRDAGCCEVIFETEVAVLELLSEVCSSAIGPDGKLSPYAAAECRKSVNTTCGLDIAEFLKRDHNVRKTSKALLEMMKSSNSTCLQEHFGVPVWSLSKHTPWNPWIHVDLKQERPIIRGAGPHPALRERGRAIPPSSGVPTPPSRVPVPLPPHARVRSPLSVYYEVDFQPPPIPGMRPPLGSPGGPVPAPKSSMSFVMPIYTICIIVFFVYTLSKILFKRTGSSPYEVITPDPQFRSRVFRDDSRVSPDTKFGHKERDAIVTAISGLVAEVQQQLDASFPTNQQRVQDVQDDLARPYTNGSVLSNNAPRIIATEYKEDSPEKLHNHREQTPERKQFVSEPKETSPEPKEFTPQKLTPELQQQSPKLEEVSSEPEEFSPEPEELNLELEELKPEPIELSPEPEELNLESEALKPDSIELSPEPEEWGLDLKEQGPEAEQSEIPKELSLKSKEETPEKNGPPVNYEVENDEPKHLLDETLERIKSNLGSELEKLTSESTEGIEKSNSLAEASADFIAEAKQGFEVVSTPVLEAKSTSTTEKKQSTPELLAEALKESPEKYEVSEEEVEEEEVEEEEEDQDLEKSTVKVMGMTVSAHSADGGAWPEAQSPVQPRPPHRQEPEDVPEIYLEGDIPQQSRVLVADFDDTANKNKDRHSPLVVSGKMTLSLIQDSPRETPDREQESTVDDYTTASAVTQPAAEKKDDMSDEEIEEEEIEEIEEEMEIEEIEEEDEEEDKKPEKK